MGWSGNRKPFVEIELPPEAVSDALPSADHPRYAELEPEADRRARFRRALMHLLLVSVFVTGTGAALFAERGLLDRVRLSRQLQASEIAVAEQRERVSALRVEVEGLKHDPSSRERIAREQLGLVRPGELLFLLPDEPVEGTGDPE